MNVKIQTWQQDDAESLAKALNNKKVLDNLRDGIPFPYTIKDARDFISMMQNSDKESTFSWAIKLNETCIGSIGAFRKDNLHKFTAEMGYYIAEEHWGKGIGAIAINEACKYIFENTDIIRIFAEPFLNNIASCKVLEKCGFVREGVLRKNAVKNGVVMDMVMYSIVRD